jgi:hypothetical protein
MAAYHREVMVAQRIKDLMRALKPNEVMVVYPIGGHALMKDLETHGAKVLGNRCIILRRQSKDPPAEWADLKQPIKQFLDAAELPGREEFLRDIPPAVRAELEREIRAACLIHGYDWNTAALEVVYTSRMYALDIEQALAKAGMYLDPATTQSEAFGEGFEECAMTWKAMVVPYLGLQHPALNNWDLSVGGAVFLKKLRQRVELDNQICLFIWDGVDGSLYALFARAWTRLAEPRYRVYLPVAGTELELWSQIKYGSKLWPGPESAFRPEAGRLELPVFNSIRRDAGDQPVYIRAVNLTPAAFRQHLLKARIAASAGGS